ncbi:MAG: recombinase family protein [Variovorax sp.]
MLIGYARVSTSDQETRLQLDALKRAGVRRVFAEKTSGIGPRPELHKALAELRPGGTLVVYKIDRLARSLKDLLSLLERLRLAGCALKSLTEPIDTSSAMGELVLQILGAVAQFERSIIRERCMAGRVAARERGQVFGRPRDLSDDDAAEVVRLYQTGLYTLPMLADVFGVGVGALKNAVYRYRALLG